MAATEEVATAPAETPVAAEAGAAPVFDDNYDESLLIKVKGKVKRPVRPDDTERNLQVQKLQEQIDKASARVKEIKEILDSRASGKGAPNPQQQAIRDRIQQLRGDFDALLVSGVDPRVCTEMNQQYLFLLVTRAAAVHVDVQGYHRITAFCFVPHAAPNECGCSYFFVSYDSTASEEAPAESE